jgi:hypothetical protein
MTGVAWLRTRTTRLKQGYARGSGSELLAALAASTTSQFTLPIRREGRA